MFAVSSRRVLPGFTLSLGTSLLFVCLILLLPLSALVMQLAQMSWAQYWEVITNPQVVAAYKVTLLSAFVASIFNGVFGLLMAWILTRYRFPGRTLLDALMDLPFALPTAVAGLTLASLFSVNGFTVNGWRSLISKSPIPGLVLRWRWPLPAFRLWCVPCSGAGRVRPGI